MEDNKTKTKSFKLKKKDRQFLITAFLFSAIAAFISLLILKAIYPTKTSQDLGSTINGVLGTYLGFFGSILVYKALSEQVKANNLIQDQFIKQQFESRLFKMLEIYNLQVSDLRYKNRKTGVEYLSKNVFPVLVYDVRELKKDIINFNTALEYDIKKMISKKYGNELQSLNHKIKIEEWVLTEISYIIFFYGVGVTGRPNILNLLKKRYKKEYLKTLLNYLSNKPVFHNMAYSKYQEEWKELSTFALLRNFDKPNENNFDRYYNGTQNNLGHYYRHLFMISRFINKQSIWKYLDKWEYSKLLRTQMSNHEQELFFINSISILGREWEINQKNENDKLITKFDLIKNLSKGVRKKYKIKKFYCDVEFEDKPGLTPYREYLEKEIYN